MIQDSLGKFTFPDGTKLAPKIFVLTMFKQEAANWLSADSAFDFSHKVSLTGLSHGYGDIYCTPDADICLMIMGTALINAALSMSEVTSSGRFDLTKTYFLMTGIAGVNPRVATIGSVALAKFAIQVDTQMEFDGREIPSHLRTGYIPMNADSPDSMPSYFHGTEVYELNGSLRDIALSLAKNATLEDSHQAQQTRNTYASAPDDMYHAATLGPTILPGDVLSSNVFWHGYLISEAMDNVTKVYTSGKANYVMTAQEDNAIIAALLRAALKQQVDYSRIILMRSASNFDREPSRDEPVEIPLKMDHGGMEPALRNLYLSGVEIVRGILTGWSETYQEGIPSSNYLGDVYGSLGGKPDFLVGAVLSDVPE